MSLDSVAARMVMRARQIERALHDPGPWSISVGSHRHQWKIPARKVVGDTHVSFIAVVPLDEGDVVFAELMSGDDIVAVKALSGTGRYAEVTWTFEVVEAAVQA